MDKAKELLIKLNDTIKILNLDMGGKHTYMISSKSNEVITEIRKYLWEEEVKKDEDVYSVYIGKLKHR